MGTNLHLRELCGLWSFFGNVNVEQIPPGDLFCVLENAAGSPPAPAGLTMQYSWELNQLVWKPAAFSVLNF